VKGAQVRAKEHADQRQDREPPVDQWDMLVIGGSVLLFAGLWLWVSLGCALTVVGALALALGAVGAYNGSRPAAAGSGERAGAVARRRIGQTA
jgi:hypothetical protein